MNIVGQILFSLCGWVFIICLSAIEKKNVMKNNGSMFEYEEIVKNGNGLFSTALFYILASLLCKFLTVTLVKWIIMIILIIFTVIPVFSSLLLLFSYQVKLPHKLSAIISQFIPLVIAINIYFMYLKK